MSDIPTRSGKTTIDKLGLFERREWRGRLEDGDDPVVYNCDVSGFRFDFVWRPKPVAKRLFVFFSGDAMRKDNNPPVFQRWSWAEHFDGHCLYISDPSLYLNPKLGLAWYAGTADFDPMHSIASIVTSVAEQTGVSLADTYMYGSSGGGFASLRALLFLPDISAIVINPQTNVFKFRPTHVELYLRVCFGGIAKELAEVQFSDRLNLIPRVPEFSASRIIYIQNTLDTQHFDDHFTPFCEAMGTGTEENLTEGNFRKVLFAHEGGHGKAETPEAFGRAMDVVRSWG